MKNQFARYAPVLFEKKHVDSMMRTRPESAHLDWGLIELGKVEAQQPCLPFVVGKDWLVIDQEALDRLHPDELWSAFCEHLHGNWGDLGPEESEAG